MYSAGQAKADLPNARIARFEEAIKYAVSQGKPLCYSYTRAMPEDIEYLEEHGYRAHVDTSGVTWIYWN
jgi:hypothetical protein